MKNKLFELFFLLPIQTFWFLNNNYPNSQVYMYIINNSLNINFYFKIGKIVHRNKNILEA